MSCQCKTKSGKKCSRKAEGKSKYCWQHQQKAPGPKSSKSKRNIKSPGKLSGSDHETQRKFCSCVMKVKSQGKNVNPWAVCTASVGRISNSCKEFE